MVDWDRFETLWTFLLAASSQDWTGNLLRYLELEYIVKLFEATGDDRRVYPDTQFEPYRYSELVVGVLLNRKKSLTAFASVLLN